jgi:hypothetical protein
LVPLIIRQAGSDVAERWVVDDPQMVVWTLAAVEVSSAIHRLTRDGRVAPRVAEEAERRCSDLMATCHVVVDVESVKDQARRLLRLHVLRAADALQLGAALEWTGGRPSGRVLHTLDERLATAARREGFEVPSTARN